MGRPNFNLKPTMIIEDAATAEDIAYYSRSDAGIFSGLTTQGLNKRVTRFNKEHPNAPVHKISFGGRAVYYTQEDLHRLSALTVVKK